MADTTPDIPGEPAPALKLSGLWCAPCITESRIAEMLHQPQQQIHPAATIMQGTAICDVVGRHRMTVQTPGSSLLIPQPGMPLN